MVAGDQQSVRFIRLRIFLIGSDGTSRFLSLTLIIVFREQRKDRTVGAGRYEKTKEDRQEMQNKS